MRASGSKRVDLPKADPIPMSQFIMPKMKESPPERDKLRTSRLRLPSPLTVTKLLAAIPRTEVNYVHRKPRQAAIPLSPHQYRRALQHLHETHLMAVMAASQAVLGNFQDHRQPTEIALKPRWHSTTLQTAGYNLPSQDLDQQHQWTVMRRKKMEKKEGERVRHY